MTGYIKSDYIFEYINNSDIIIIHAQFGVGNAYKHIEMKEIEHVVTHKLIQDCLKTHKIKISTISKPPTIQTVLNRTKYHYDYIGQFQLC